MLLLPALLCLACFNPTPEQEARADTIAALEADLDLGEGLYASDCASCHGADGEGDSGPDLAKAVDEDAAELVLILMWGPEKMPSFEDWPDQDLADVVAWTQTLGQ